MASASSMFDEVLDAEVSGNPIDPSLMSNERLGEVLAQMQSVVDLVDDMKAEVQRRLHRGVGVPHFELVNYTPPSSWKEGAKERLAALMKAKTIPSLYKDPAIITPKQARTLLKEQADVLALVEKEIDTHDVKPVVGPSPERRKLRGDNRKSWNGRAPESMFEDESGTDVAPTSVMDMFPED
jgi:Asp-tRNA(Asn)/Glu-tRNA(Gln) amidotransferase C subunit